MGRKISTQTTVQFIADLTPQLAKETDAPQVLCEEDGLTYTKDMSMPSGFRAGVLTFAAPLARNGNSISIQTANTNQPGALTAADWNAFNAKESAITAGTASQYWRGDKSWRDFAGDVRGAVLTGLSTATNAVITAGDTVLAAVGKLQAQISAIGLAVAALQQIYLRGGTAALPAIAITVSTDVSVTYGAPFPQLAGKTAAETAALIQVVPNINGAPTALLGTLSATVKTKSLTGCVVTVKNSGLLGLSIGVATVDVVALLTGN